MKNSIYYYVLIQLFTSLCFFTFAQESKIFEIVRKGDVNELKTYIEANKSSINAVNLKGYSPLHVLIENYVEYRYDWKDKDNYKYEQSIQKYELYRSCLKLLLENGASPRQFTPEGWNALQYAVVKGKIDAVKELLYHSKGGDVRDDYGNTLLHLSLLINPDEPVERFWEYLINEVRPYNISISTLNFDGQTPIAFYMSIPRCNPVSTKPQSSGKLLGAVPANSVTPPCHTPMTKKMIDNFLHHSALLTPDFSGKTALDYVRIHNTWAQPKLEGYIESYKRVQAEWEPHLKQFAQQAEENKRKIQEFEARKAEESKQGASKPSGCSNVCYSCQGFGSGKEKAVQVECPVCYGRGNTGYSKSEISGFVKDYTYYTPQTCYKCNGSGRRTVYEQQNCSSCKGRGCLD